MQMNRRWFAKRMAAGIVTATVASRCEWAFADATARPFHLSVMLWTLRPKYTAEQAIEMIGRAGYNGFELVDEDKRWSGADVERVRGRMAKLGLVCDAMSGIDIGFAEPGAGERLAAELTARMEQAERLGCRRIILLSGKRVPGMTRDAQHAVCVENLKRAAQLAAERKFELLLEPIDALENPSIYLTHVAEAFEIVRALNSPAVKVLYDFYHEARGNTSPQSTAPLVSLLQGNAALLGLVHIANVPGRSVPGVGNIDYSQVYRSLETSGYRGWVAMEFLPVGDAETEIKEALRGISTEP